MKKWERLVHLAITETGAKVLSRKKAGGHLRLTLQLPAGHTHKLTVSSSPITPEFATRAIKREVLNIIASSPSPPERHPCSSTKPSSSSPKKRAPTKPAASGTRPPPTPRKSAPD